MTDNNSEQTKNNIEKEKVDSSKDNTNKSILSIFQPIFQPISQIDEPDIEPSNATTKDIYLYGKYVNNLQSKADNFLTNLGLYCVFSFVFFGSLTDFSPLLRPFILTMIIFIPGVAFYYLKHIKNIQRAEEKLRLIKEGYQNSLLEDPNRRCIYFLRQLRELTAYSAGMFSNEESKKKDVSDLRKQIGGLLQQENHSDDMNEVEYLLSSLRELIESERIEQKNQKKLRIFNVILIFFYIAVLVFVMFYTWTNNSQFEGQGPNPNNFKSNFLFKDNTEIPFLGVPLWAIIWGAMGSLSAVLYRFYTTKKIQVSQETQWLIARPLIGILMSAVAYLAVASGLIVLGASPPDLSTSTSNTEPENVRRVTSIICFLAGFSERVYIGLIGLLTDRTLGNSSSDNDNSETSKNKSKPPDLESDKDPNNTQPIDDPK